MTIWLSPNLSCLAVSVFSQGLAGEAGTVGGTGPRVSQFVLVIFYVLWPNIFHHTQFLNYLSVRSLSFCHFIQ